ncbi:MAG: hypothetical protein ACTII7_09715 [Galactobacter sp.]
MNPFLDPTLIETLTHPALAADIFETAKGWATDGKTVVSAIAVLIVSFFIIVPIVKSGFSIGKLLVAVLCGALALWFINGSGMDWLQDMFTGTTNGS